MIRDTCARFEVAKGAAGIPVRRAFLAEGTKGPKACRQGGVGCV